MGGDAAARRFDRVTWALLVLALGLRVAWALLASTELRLDHVFNDATARSLAAGRGFTASLEPPLDPAVFRTPGYSAFVAVIYGAFGPSVRAVFVVQALVDTLSCALIAGLALRRMGRRAATVAVTLAATYPFTIHAVGRHSAETLSVLLGVLLLIALDRLAPHSRVGRLSVLGVVLGLAAWVKPVFLPLPAVLVVAEFVRGRRLPAALLRAAIVGVIALGVFAPWVIRNVAAFDRPVIAGELGLVVWHGTYDFAADRDAMIAQGFADEDAAVGPAATPAERREATRRRFADSPELLRRDAEFLDRGLARLRADPWRGFLLDPLRRIPRLWISTTYVGGPAWIGWSAAAGCVGYLALAAIGLWRLRGTAGSCVPWLVLPITLTLVHATLHVEARYTLPARPTLFLLGAAAIAGRRKRADEGTPAATIAP